MSVHDLGTWLRQQRRARGWPVPEMARRLREAAKDSGDNTVPGNEAMCRNLRRWESGGGGVSERYQLHYCEALGLSPAQFGPGRPQETADALARPVRRPGIPAMRRSRGWNSSRCGCPRRLRSARKLPQHWPGRWLPRVSSPRWRAKKSRGVGPPRGSWRL